MNKDDKDMLVFFAGFLLIFACFFIVVTMITFIIFKFSENPHIVLLISGSVLFTTCIACYFLITNDIYWILRNKIGTCIKRIKDKN